jgi:cell division protein FtsW
MDPWLFFAAMALSCLGLVMVYSSSAWLAKQTTHSWEYYLQRQAIFFGIGLAIMVVCSRLDYRVLRRFALQLMGFAVILLVVVLFVGREVNGAQRWISVGPANVQPSEIAKMSLAIFLAAILARQGERVRSFKKGFLPVVIVSGLTMLLVYLERDLGTTILLGSLTLILLFVAGTRASYVVAAMMLAAPVVWSGIINVGYRRGRVESFFAGDDYQVQQSLISIGSGGPWGVGLGNGRQKLGFLPENHTDFILATTGEELGLVGITVVIGLFSLLVWRGLLAARQAPDRFGTYLATGLSAVFGLQALVNMAVVLRIIPAKGITLPFLSSGGSSLLVSMAAVGLLLSISRRPEAWRISDQRRRRSNKRKQRDAVKARNNSGSRPNVRRPAPATG